MSSINPPPIAIVVDGPWNIPPPKPAVTTVLGLVVGQHEIPTTICAVRYDTALLTPGDPLCGEEPVWETHYHVLGIEALELSTSYPAIASRVNMLARRLYNRDDRGDYHVLADASDVGRPVVDAIRDSILPQVHVTSVRMVGEDRADLSILWRNDATIGREYLISRLKAILQARRLHVPADLTKIIDAIRDHVDGSEASSEIRALALCCGSEYMSVGYDVSPDLLPSAAF